jgi:hypothetical protein
MQRERVGEGVLHLESTTSFAKGASAYRTVHKPCNLLEDWPKFQFAGCGRVDFGIGYKTNMLGGSMKLRQRAVTDLNRFTPTISQLVSFEGCDSPLQET